MGGGDPMAAAGDGPSFREMREALERHFQAHGVRASARELCMSPSGVEGLVRRATRPSESTRRKLRQWYARAASE